MDAFLTLDEHDYSNDVDEDDDDNDDGGNPGDNDGGNPGDNDGGNQDEAKDEPAGALFIGVAFSMALVLVSLIF